MDGTQQTSSIDFQDGGKVETRADGLNAGTPPVAPNPHESNTERMLRQLLRNQEMTNARVDRSRQVPLAPRVRGSQRELP